MGLKDFFGSRFRDWRISYGNIANSSIIFFSDAVPLERHPSNQSTEQLDQDAILFMASGSDISSIDDEPPATASYQSISPFNGLTRGKKTKRQLHEHVLNVVLIRGKNLCMKNDYFIRLRLGKAKCKSKVSAFAILTFRFA